MELDCTRDGAGSRDRFIRVDHDNGEAVVTKSSCSTSAACGRLNDGRALSVYIVYAMGNNYEASWAPEITIPVAGSLLNSINSHNKQYERADCHATTII